MSARGQRPSNASIASRRSRNSHRRRSRSNRRRSRNSNRLLPQKGRRSRRANCCGLISSRLVLNRPVHGIAHEPCLSWANRVWQVCNCCYASCWSPDLFQLLCTLSSWKARISFHRFCCGVLVKLHHCLCFAFQHPKSDLSCLLPYML